ncbi:hypothetical protein, partial [Bradyrhizobium sp.]|uniref:hypothetical protein n=1 Tax=Bradyrhizobium sp. TaxID=376 RepID=UPI00391A1CCF
RACRLTSRHPGVRLRALSPNGGGRWLRDSRRLGRGCGTVLRERWRPADTGVKAGPLLSVTVLWPCRIGSLNGAQIFTAGKSEIKAGR